MIKLFIDSDIIIDLLTKREEYMGAAALFTKISNGEFIGYTSPIVFANVHYIIAKYKGKVKSLQSLRNLRKILSVLSVDQEIIDKALLSSSSDFEDAIQFTTAETHLIDFIITRNKKDFKESTLPVQTATEFLNLVI
jgi:predicted nucleic acid-binding protein